MQYSVVSIKNLNDEFRIDSEYYKPDNLTSENVVKRHKYELLGNICKLITGPFGSAVTTDKYDTNSNRRYIRGKDIQSFFVEQSDPVFIQESLFEELSRFHLQEMDILITVVGMKFGKVGIVYLEDCPAIFSCKSTLLRNASVNIFFLAAYLSSEIGYRLVRRGQRGAAQPGINLFDIQNIPVPILSATFQNGVGDLIIKARLRIQKSTSIYTEAEKILLSELGLLDWKPKHCLSFVKNYSGTQQAGRFDAEYYQPKYDEIVAAVKSYAGGWDTLGNLVSVKKCIEVGSGEYSEEGTPFVRVSNLSPFEITEEKYISEKLYSELTPEDGVGVPFTKSKNHQPKKGEILFSKDATPGIAHFLSEEPQKMVPSGGILRLKLKGNRVEPNYLTLVLNSLIVKEQINRDVGGSVILHWRPDQVKQTLIPILDKDKQEQIRQKITDSFTLRKQSTHLLECAKKAVEIAIEKSEEEAEKWLKKEMGIVDAYYQ
jgi:restriction endonuclease S subunit